MSAVYNLEPQPTAKVILHTTSGDLSLELFAQQTPLASRNFLQLCLDGYYTGTIFHRLIPGFILQGGDPTGTGAGGESSFPAGAPFADEFHSRLKFNRRGLLGMANGGAKDDNGSQFFLTLGRADELNNKHTMFGRVEAGNTIFNLVKMGEVELAEGEGSERPMFPTRITGSEVLVNPFEGMVAREKVVFAPKEEKKVVRKAKKKAGKQLLSFGGADDGEEGEEAAAPVKAAKFNPLLVNTVPEKAPAVASSSQKRQLPPSSRTAEPPSKRRQASFSPSPPPTRPVQTTSTTNTRPAAPPRTSPSCSPSPPPITAPKPSALELANQQIAALKASLKRDVPTADSMRDSKPRSALETMIPSTATRGRKRKGGGTAGGAGATLTRDEQSALDSLLAFRRRLEAVPTASTDDEKLGANGKSPGGDVDNDETLDPANEPRNLPAQAATDPAPPAPADDDEALLCDLHFIAHCQSCKKWDADLPDDDRPRRNANEGVTEDDEGWMAHQLSFAKDRMGKDLEWKRQNERELVVIDPREKEREVLGKRKAAARGEREREKGVGRVDGAVGGRR